MEKHYTKEPNLSPSPSGHAKYLGVPEKVA